jgi:hypothetical protein
MVGEETGQISRKIIAVGKTGNDAWQHFEDIAFQIE